MVQLIVHGQETIQLSGEGCSIVINPRLDNPHTHKRILWDDVDVVLITPELVYDNTMISSLSHNHGCTLLQLDADNSRMSFMDICTVSYIHMHGFQGVDIQMTGKNILNILYVLNQPQNILPDTLSHKYDALAVSLQGGDFVQYQDLCTKIQCAYVLPIYEHSAQEAIEFCRQVMLHNCGVPKYLKPGQYVIVG